MLVFSILFGFGNVTAKADTAVPYVYADENFKVTYAVNGTWENHVTATIEIENIGNETIRNWFLGMALDGEIKEIWNAAIYRHVKDHYVIKNANHNSNIAPGEKVSFGCVIKCSDTTKVPEEFYMPIKTEAVRARRYDVQTEIVSAWEDGQKYQITVQNTSKQTIEDWTVEFDFGLEINSLWDSVLVSEENGYYILTNNNYNNTIAPGESVSFGFITNGSQPLYPENIVLNEITSDGIKIAEKLVDSRNFVDFDIVSEEYEVTPLYTIDGQISAYLVQYYNNGEATGYIVVSNEVDCMNYYIEFGYGTPGVIWGMVDAVEDECGKPVDRVIYAGGYTYYALVEDTVYTADTGEARLVTAEEEKLVAASDVQYYEKGVTLTLFDIFNKEVGYVEGTEGYSPDRPLFTSYITMEEAEDAYWNENTKIISGHCAPTAGINLLIYLQNRGYDPLSIAEKGWEQAFCILYDKMKTSDKKGTAPAEVFSVFDDIFSGYKGFNIGIILFLKWETAKKHIEKSGVFLCLEGSQIYGDHGVFANGYITFLHSSGWHSKYFQIVDGKDKSYRYVNYSLGIDAIRMIIVEPSN